MAIATITTWLNDPQRNYTEGCKLFAEHSKDALLLALFKGGNGKSPYHVRRLISELENIQLKDAAVAITKVVTGPRANLEAGELDKLKAFKQVLTHNVIKEALSITDQLSRKPDAPKRDAAVQIPLAQMGISERRHSVNDKDWAKLPDKIKDLYTENSQLHSHSAMLFGLSRAAADPRRRLELDLQILDEREQLNKNWKVIQDFQSTGILIEEAVKKAQLDIDGMTLAQCIKHGNNLVSYICKARGRMAAATDDRAKEKQLVKIAAWEHQQAQIKLRLEAGK